MIPVREFWVDDTSHETLLDHHDRAEGIVLLVGSGVSRFSPSGLAPGSVVTAQIAEVIVPESQDDRWVVARRLVSDAALESVLHRFPQQDTLQSVVRDLYRRAGSNPVHAAIAYAIQRGLVRHVITTNYDCGIELGLHPAPFERVVSKSEYKQWAGHSAVLFKFHGSADHSDPLLISLAHESRPPEWKIELLARLMTDRTIVVCGYSGMDFEVSRPSY